MYVLVYVRILLIALDNVSKIVNQIEFSLVFKCHTAYIYGSTYLHSNRQQFLHLSA